MYKREKLWQKKKEALSSEKKVLVSNLVQANFSSIGGEGGIVYETLRLWRV